MAEVILNDQNFQKEVLEDKGVVLVDFWASWCAPCLMMAPFVEEISKEYESKAKICKFNVEESQGIPSRYGIMAIPTTLIFKSGQLVDKIVGLVPKNVLAGKLDNQLKQG